MPLAPPWIKSQSPRFSCAALEHVVPDGEDGLGQSGGFDHGKALRHRKRGCLGRHGEAGIAAAIDQRADVIAKLEPRRAGPKRRNNAGDFEAEQIGGALGRGIETLALQHVGPVDAGGFDLDQDLVRPPAAAPAARRGPTHRVRQAHAPR